MQQVMFLCVRCRDALSGIYSVSDIRGTDGKRKCDFCGKMRNGTKYDVSNKNAAGAGTPTAVGNGLDRSGE